ncbi:MAG TPA: hypothetical protein DEB09_05830 [Candidatus Magasanikbacteria bacterium]|nr:hypothetical protein [Candidatus Magasanikbacteria bacterium]
MWPVVPYLGLHVRKTLGFDLSLSLASSDAFVPVLGRHALGLALLFADGVTRLRLAGADDEHHRQKG